MMTYIILAAGKGNSLKPLTLKYPKTSYKLDEETTVLQRMVRQIRKFQNNAEIVVVVGYMADTLRHELLNDNVKFVFNPFYEVTNSISSLWFAKEYLERENVTILHGDVVYDDEIAKKYIVEKTDYPYILVDSSEVKDGGYNVVCKDKLALVMSRQVENPTARYACLSKLDAVTARLLKQEIVDMLNYNMYDQYYEDALVQMIMFHNLQLNCIDIEGHNWREVNDVDDLLAAQHIQIETL